MNEDFLLIILKDVLRRRPDLKLVLMSATLNAAMFARYKKRSFLNSKKHIHLRKR
jgi:HrpA-like RNA helicase